MDTDAAVRFVDVSFAYGRLPLLAGVRLEVPAGQTAYVVGRSGSGKTTLLRLAHGELRPQTGRVTAGGRVAMVFQDARLLPRLTALENVAYALRVADLRLGAGEARRRARAALYDAGLEARVDALPAQLSAGQRQRVAAARAIAARPAVLLADEPTANLDADAAGAVLDLLERVARSGGAVLIATCDAGLAGRRPEARVIRLKGGMLLESHAAGRERCAS